MDSFFIFSKIIKQRKIQLSTALWLLFVSLFVCLRKSFRILLYVPGFVFPDFSKENFAWAPQYLEMKHYMCLTHWESQTQRHSVTLQKTWIIMSSPVLCHNLCSLVELNFLLLHIIQYSFTPLSAELPPKHIPETRIIFWVISGFRREVAENCAILGYYAASSGNFFRRFWTIYRSHPQGSRIRKELFISSYPMTHMSNYVNIFDFSTEIIKL